MAENTVLKEALTEEMIQAGAQLIRKLDEFGVPVATALWLLDTEINEWRLLLASPLVAREGRLVLYETIHRAEAQLGERPAAVLFSAISLARDDDDLIKRLRATVHTGADIERIRFHKNVADGHFIEDALIYRST